MNNKVNECLNCGLYYQEGDHYCSNCGQKTDAHLLTVTELLSNFWNSLFNLDNTVFSTLKYIWRPWKLTEFYVKGKRKTYLNPMRIFLITLLLHFGLLLTTVDIDNNKTLTNELYREYERSKIKGEYMDIKSKLSLDGSACVLSDSIENVLFAKTLLVEQDTQLSIEIFGDKKYPFTKKDVLELPIDSVYQKYKITTFTEKLIVGQYFKIMKDQAGTGNYVIGNFAWGVLLIIIALAAFMKLLYYKKKLHYVEHLVFLMNVHSFCFLVNALVFFICAKFDDFESKYEVITNFILLSVPLVTMFLSLFYYYKQGFFKTLLKYFILGFMYTVFFGIFIVIVSLVSLILF
ncbi:MAG TPA: DUF3667 domain-containing protein [Saprospiraceae bacterium]|nr:DUF3667 domain-containing protein [Saprospiraceae bacterium]HMU03894.1 DUF3667 domain-containing protein [Saprospiraceae bacterium]